MLLLQAGLEVLRFVPPLVIPVAEIDEGLSRLCQAIATLRENSGRGAPGEVCWPTIARAGP